MAEPGGGSKGSADPSEIFGGARSGFLRGPLWLFEEPALPFEGPALALEGPALALEGPALALEGPALALEGLAMALQGPALALQGPALALVGPALALEGPLGSLLLCRGRSGFLGACFGLGGARSQSSDPSEMKSWLRHC